jgi:hypothetical protein
MARHARREVVEALMARHGRTFAEEAGINLSRGTPSPLYRLSCLALLHSAPVGGDLAMRGTVALADHGLRTARAMLEASWGERARVLNRSGYARVDERTATMLGEGARLLMDRWRGDLRRLREEAGRDPARQRELLKELKGIGDVGADIFLREVQGVWPEVAPFADRRARAGARRLGLPVDARALARLVPGAQLTRLVAALVRADLAGDTPHRLLARDRAA